MSNRRDRLITAALGAISWLGAATLAWSIALTIDLGLRKSAVAIGDATVYVGALAITVSAAWSGIVAIFFGLRTLAERFRSYGVVALMLALLASVVRPINALADVLTEGDFISHQSYVRWVRIGLITLFVAGWHVLWLWHAWGTSPRLRARLREAAGTRAYAAAEIAFIAFGAGALPVVFLTMRGLLRPYLPMAEALAFPSWLVAATLVFRALGAIDRPRITAAVALLVVGVGGTTFALRAHDPVRGSATRNAALADTGWIALSAARFQPWHSDTLGHLDFAAAAAAKKCRKPKKLPKLAAPATERRNVILLSIDTMRRDAIGKRFGERKVAPNIEQFAQESVFFERATAAGPGTLFSIGSLLTGRSVDQLLWQRRVPDTIFTQSSKRFDRQMIMLPDWNVVQHGMFQRLFLQATPTQFVKRRGDPARSFIDELDRARTGHERVFFWLHLVDAHHPYHVKAKYNFGPTTAAAYYSEVAFDDGLIGRVLDHLREQGWMDDSLVIVFSDHGESLGEGGYWGHGVSMRGRFTDVPLYVHAPGVPPRASQAPVMLTQIAPTVLHFVDQPLQKGTADCSLLLPEAALRKCAIPVSSARGLRAEAVDKAIKKPVRSLKDLERRTADIDRWRRFPPEITATTGDYRYVIDMRTGAERLHRRGSDPDELHDLAASRPDLLAQFRSRLEDWRHEEAQRVVCDVLR